MPDIECADKFWLVTILKHDGVFPLYDLLNLFNKLLALEQGTHRAAARLRINQAARQGCLALPTEM
jgi:hypothetical protein